MVQLYMGCWCLIWVWIQQLPRYAKMKHCLLLLLQRWRINLPISKVLVDFPVVWSAKWQNNRNKSTVLAIVGAWLGGFPFFVPLHWLQVWFFIFGDPRPPYNMMLCSKKRFNIWNTTNYSGVLNYSKVYENGVLVVGLADVPNSFNGSFVEIDECLAEGRNSDRNEIAYLCFFSSLALWIKISATRNNATSLCKPTQTKFDQ